MGLAAEKMRNAGNLNAAGTVWKEQGILPYEGHFKRCFSYSGYPCALEQEVKIRSILYNERREFHKIDRSEAFAPKVQGNEKRCFL